MRSGGPNGIGPQDMIGQQVDPSKGKEDWNQDMKYPPGNCLYLNNLKPALYFVIHLNLITMKRRTFVNSLIGTSVGSTVLHSIPHIRPGKSGPGGPVVVSTWDFGMKANAEAWKVLSAKGRGMDAVEQGVRLVEADPTNQSVGLGGLPDRDGHVTLDACVMDETGNAGSVCFLEHILHPVSVARKVMEDTPHVILSGQGALQFALEQGFKKTDLLTAESRKAWEKWKEKSE